MSGLALALRWLGWRGCVALAAIVLGSFCAWRWHAAAGTVHTLRAEARQWSQANRDNVAAIKDLHDANAAWSGLADAQRARADAAVNDAAAVRDTLQREREQHRRERQSLYAKDPGAAAWGRAAVPAAVADSLRKGHRPD